MKGFSLSELVSWCFEPSQPQKVISGLRVSTEMHSTESSIVKGPQTICRRMDALFSPEILQAGTAKGLSRLDSEQLRPLSNFQQSHMTRV